VRKELIKAVSSLEEQFSYASALSEVTRGLRIKKYKEETKIIQIPTKSGVVLTVFDGEKFIESSITEVTPSNLENLVKNLKKEVTPHKKLFNVTPGEPVCENFYSPMKINFLKVELPEKIEKLDELFNKISAIDQRIINVEIRYEEDITDKLFINRNKLLFQSIPRLKLVIILYVAELGKYVQVIHSEGHSGGFELITEFSDATLERLHRQAIELLSARPITPGYYQIIADPSVSGIIAHETFGHGVELDMFLKERAKASEFLGKTLAPEIVNIVDDPTLPGAFGSYFFDDEGFIPSPTYIIENGVFKRPLNDFYSHLHFPKLPKTANGRRESITNKVYARMSNTFFAAGNLSLEELLETTDDGIYLEKGLFGMEDPKGWGVQVNAMLGKEIKNGKFTGICFSPITITGFVPELLKNITGISKEFALTPGSCGKGYKEMIPVSTGGAHIKTKARLG